MTEAQAAPISAPDTLIVPATPQISSQSDRPQGAPRQETRSRDKRRSKNSNRPSGGDSQEKSGRGTTAPRDESRKAIDVPWDTLVELAGEYNRRPGACWEVCRIFDADRVYFQLQRKNLNEAQIETFEDDRVTGPVMRGERPPTTDEYWRRLYRDEVKSIQAVMPIRDVWMAETPPEKKASLRWGPPVPKQQPVDRDSQEFFLQKQQKAARRDDGQGGSRRRHAG